MISYIVSADGTKTAVEVKKESFEDRVVLTFPRELVPQESAYLDFCPEYLCSGIDPEGYMVVPRGTKEGGAMLCRFHERQDTEYVADSNYMPLWGFKTAEQTVLAVVTGMAWDYQLVAGVRDNVYYAFPRFTVDPETTYEDLQVTYYQLPKGSGYSEMARFYRNIRLQQGCVPLKERVKNRPELKYAVESTEIRIRMAWKPCPSPVKEQTVETEPPVTTACTASRVEELVDEMEKQGVKQAEICLVGFETKGHDGRWPQIFPVEESIGGETAVRAAIAHGKAKGYQMVAHTNCTEMYRISEDWDEEKIIRKRDGSLLLDVNLWGGGQPYMLCPSEGVKFARERLPQVADMGFRGLHYIDVLSIFPPRKCYHPAHPLNRKESIAYIREVMQISRDIFGGFASEGGFDFSLEDLDYALYTSYNVLGKQPDICDEAIPFLQMIFHGIILYNPCTETVNYCVKPEVNHLKFIEYGGRPLAYYYSKYVGEGGCGNWMGEEDLRCDTQEQLVDSVARIKKMQEEYEKLSYLQYEFMERHEEVSPNVFEVEYSDGTVITVDYNTGTYEVRKH